MRYKLMFFILVTGFFTESLSTTEPGEILVTSTETPGLEPDVGDVTTVTTTDEINDGNDFITTTDVPDATTLIEEVTFQTEPDITTEAVTEQSDDNDKISSIENSNLPLDSNLAIQQKNLSNPAISNINLDSEKEYPTENPETSLDEEPVDKLVAIENEPTHHDDKPVDLENQSMHHDKPEARENESTPHAISKRILISSTTDSINNPINLHEHSEASLDSWRPVRPPVESSIRFPSETSPQPVINSFSNPRNNYPVSKEPVTAYYFDLTSAAPYPPRGPLFDPSSINDFSLGVSSEVVPKDNIEQNLSTRVHDSVSQPTGIDQNVNPEDTEDSKDNIKPTPTQPITNFTPETNESTLNIDHGNDLPATRGDNISSQGVELETIPSLYNRTATDFQQSTPAYTLGLSTDFHFTLGESDAVKNSTNILGPDSMPSTLSSDQPLETHNSTDISSADVEHSDSKDTAVEDTSHSKDTAVVEDTSDSKDAAAVEDTQESHDTSKDDSKVNVTKQPSEVPGDHSSDSTSTTVTPSSPGTKSPSSSTTLSYISPSAGSTTEREPPSDLKIETNTTQNGTFYEIFSSTTEESSDESDTTGTRVKVNVIPGDEPALHLWKMHQNGTNTTHSAPFIKAEVSYDNEQFCWHQSNIEALLRQWINLNLNDNDSEIEIFEQPDCLNLNFSNTKSDDHNVTNVYFYVKRNGTISLSSTRKFPIHPTGLGISQELEYLREKIRALELKDEESQQEISENTSNLVVVAVVAPILVIILVGAILACFIVKRRRSAETIGRRCTPAANDAYSLDSVSVFYHSLRRKSKKRASNKSLKSYLNQGFDDPNQPSRPLSFAKLTLFITDNEAINDEFSNIPSIVPKYDEMPRGVEDKNRYANVIPVPETRILLGGSKISPSAEYINANSIHGPKGELRYYIATQAPLDNTVADFWQMVWEQESKVIVMLTDFVEKGIDKCADYLPPSETLDCHRVYGEFQITLKSRDMREKYIMSLLQIKNLENNLVREIAHMWFTGWPQSGVPNEEKLFMNFIFDVRTTRKQLRAKGPIIVHCSPGTGRTGTYIACDLCMKQFDDQKVVDVPKTVFRIRRERAGAVQTKEQYSFIYRVVNFYAARLTTGNLDSF